MPPSTKTPLLPRRLLVASVAAAVTTALCPQAPASARSATDMLEMAPSATRSEHARDRADLARPVLRDAGLVSAIEAAAALVGIELTDIPAVPSVDGPDAPAPLRIALGRIMGAVVVADNLAARATASVRGDSTWIWKRIRTYRNLTRRVSDAEAPGSSIDRAKLYTAAALVAHTIDEQLPVLRTYARSSPARGDGTAACDIVDALPALCVGGTANNHYVHDAALLLDLGGNDTYLNSAGGADPQNALPISINLDLDGNDTYLSSASVSRGLQGAGVIGGIGILVDDAGNDHYSINTGEAEQDPGGHGYGFAGVGVLSDLDGNDSYSIVNQSRAQNGDFDTAIGLAVGADGGLGILRDAGASSDVYTATSTPTLTDDGEGGANVGIPSVLGLGMGVLGGTALFVDDGGSDTMELHGESATPDPADGRPTGDAYVDVYGFGASLFGGAGVMLTGEGDTARSAIAVTNTTPKQLTGGVSLLNAARAIAFGVGAIGGFGALLDTGGNDSYRLEARSRHVRHLQITDGCACNEAEANAKSAPAWTAGQGLGTTGGVGLLEDEEGDDRYIARARSDALAQIDDPSTSTTDATPQANAIGADASVVAQGAGGDGGAGFIIDRSGDDLYEAITSVEARALANGAAVATATAHAAVSWAQASAGGFSAPGYAQLYDGGGDDTYRSLNKSVASAEPAFEVEHGQTYASVQGSVSDSAVARFVDAGEGDSDTFEVEPHDPECAGVRGTGTWQDCGVGSGEGTNGSSGAMIEDENHSARSTEPPNSGGVTGGELCAPPLVPRPLVDSCAAATGVQTETMPPIVDCPAEDESRCEVWASRYDGPASTDDAAYALAISPDGDRIFTSGTSGSREGGLDVVTIAQDAVTGENLWVERYNGPVDGIDGILDIALSPDGSNLYVTGTSFSAAERDYITLAYDATTGESLWSSRHDGTAHGYDAAWTTAVSPDGQRVYVSGESTGDRDRNITTIAYDADTGTEIWNRVYDGPDCPASPGRLDVAHDLVSVPQEGGDLVAVVGITSACGQTWNAGTLVYDGMTGDKVWERAYHGRNTDIASGVDVGPDGRTLYVTGRSRSLVDSGLGGFGGLGLDFITLAYDLATGRRLWVARYDGYGENDSGQALVVSADGSTVLVTGESEFGGADGDSEIATVAYDAATGEELWRVRFDGPGRGLFIRDSGYAISADPLAERVYVAGFSGDSTRANRAVMIAYDTVSGTELWRAYHDAAAANGFSYKMAVAPDGERVYATGWNNGLTTGLDLITLAYETD